MYSHIWIHKELLSWVKQGAIMSGWKDWNFKSSKLTRQGHGETMGQLQSYSDNFIERWWYFKYKAASYLKTFKGKVALQSQTGNETEVSQNKDFVVRSILAQINDGFLGPV